MKKIDLNKVIKVKLTPLGVDVFYHQFDDINKDLASKGRKQIEPYYPEVDKDGFTELQLWCFAEIFGRYFGNGASNVISDLYIYISDEDLEEA